MKKYIVNLEKSYITKIDFIDPTTGEKTHSTPWTREAGEYVCATVKEAKAFIATAKENGAIARRI